MNILLWDWSPTWPSVCKSLCRSLSCLLAPEALVVWWDPFPAMSPAPPNSSQHSLKLHNFILYFPALSEWQEDKEALSIFYSDSGCWLWVVFGLPYKLHLHSRLAKRRQAGKVLNLCSLLEALQEAPLACLMPHMLAELCMHWHHHVRPLTPSGSCWCQPCKHRASPCVPSRFCRACQGPLCRLQYQSSSLGFPARAEWEDVFPFRHCCVAIPGAGGTLMSENLFKLLQEECAYQVTSCPLVLEEYCLQCLWFYVALSDLAAARRLALPQHHHGLASHQETAFGLTAQRLAEASPKGPWLGLTGFSGRVMGLTWPGQWIKKIIEKVVKI